MVAYKFLQTDDEISPALDHALSSPIITYDVETSGLDPYLNRMYLLQFGVPGMNYVVSLLADNALSKKDTESPVYRKFKAVAEGPKIKIGHNIGFDYKMTRAKLNIKLSNMFDTMIAERLLTVGKTKNKLSNLAEVTKKYLNRNLDKSVRSQFHKGYIINEFTQHQIEYAAGDLDGLVDIYMKQVSLLAKEDLTGVASLEFDVIPIVAMMEYRGVTIDVERWRANILEAEKQRASLRRQIETLLRPLQRQPGLWDNICTISIDSRPQLLAALKKLPGFDDLENTDKKFLRKYVDKHPVVKLLLNYSTVTKLCTSYSEELLSKINSFTGRLHGSLKQVGTDTGRFSASDPNLQQIPAKSDFRSCFVAKPGYKIVGADYSQQELRVVAYLSMEPTMLKAYKENMDLHTRTAVEIFKRDEKEFLELIKSYKNKAEAGRGDQITTEEKEANKQRGIAKTVNFLIIYGGGPSKLAFGADIPVERAKEIMEDYLKAFPGIKSYVERESHKALSLGFSRTLSGRKRFYSPLPPPTDENYSKFKAAIIRKASNVPVQGGSADIGKVAMIKVTEAFNKKFGEDNAYLMIAVHDELQCEVKEEYAEEAKEVLKEAMQDAFYHYIPKEICPIKVDANIGPHWIH